MHNTLQKGILVFGHDPAFMVPSSVGLFNKLQTQEVPTRLITRDHAPRRTDQCNLHYAVIANKNKSPR